MPPATTRRPELGAATVACPADSPIVEGGAEVPAGVGCGCEPLGVLIAPSIAGVSLIACSTEVGWRIASWSSAVCVSAIVGALLFSWPAGGG